MDHDILGGDASSDNSVCAEHDVASLDLGPTAKTSPFDKRNVIFFLMRWLRVLLQPIVIVIFWIGAWNLFDRFVFPDYAFYNEGFVWRDLMYIVSGTGGLLAVKYIWGRFKFEDEKDKFGLPKFSWRPRVWRYMRLMTTMVFGTICWCGSWNLFDYAIPSTWYRELLYIIVPIPILFLMEVFLRSSSLRFLLKIKDEKNK